MLVFFRFVGLLGCCCSLVDARLSAQETAIAVEPLRWHLAQRRLHFHLFLFLSLFFTFVLILATAALALTLADGAAAGLRLAVA